MAGKIRKEKSQRKDSKVFYLNGNKIEIYFCPEDWCTNKVLREIYNANSSVYFMAYSFTSTPISGLIAEKRRNGLDIKGIVESSQKSKYWQYDFLLNSSVKVILDKNSHLMHHKVFIIDNETVITGSFNPTANAEFDNDENLVIMHSREIAERYLNEFNFLYGLWG